MVVMSAITVKGGNIRAAALSLQRNRALNLPGFPALARYSP